MAGLRDRTVARVAAAGYGVDDPLVVGVQQGDDPPVLLGGGRTRTGGPLSGTTAVYTASLAKQITAACVALLVRGGRLDLASNLARWLPELPAWAGTVRVRHLLAHTGGLPEVLEYDELDRAGLDRTTAGVVAGLAGVEHLVSEPGTVHRYCNAGYVCLGVLVERAAGRSLADLTEQHVLAPLGMGSSRFWSGPAPHPPGAAPLDPSCPAPLSVGDGGFWSTAADLLRWNLALARDELGVSGLLQTPGRLDDDTPIDYGWGLGVREHAGHRVYRHGGRWAGLCAQLVRVDEPRSSFVVLALDDDEERAGLLADGLLDELTT